MSLRNYENDELIPIKGTTLEGKNLDLEEYSNNARKSGKCVIINNHHFDYQQTHQKDRDGTEVDARNLEDIFNNLGFDIIRFDDLSVTQMSMSLTEISQSDFSEYDSFVCIILSHGIGERVFGIDGTIEISYLIDKFKGDKCRYLVQKPKIFLIQACRGSKVDFGVAVSDSGQGDEYDSTDSVSIRKLSSESDILVAYSVVPGYFSWRNNIDGSWFVQALCQVFNKHASKIDLQRMLTVVCKLVSYEFESCTDEKFTSGHKQVPCIVSTLTKLFYFRPK